VQHVVLSRRTSASRSLDWTIHLTFTYDSALNQFEHLLCSILGGVDHGHMEPAGGRDLQGGEGRDTAVPGASVAVLHHYQGLLSELSLSMVMRSAPLVPLLKQTNRPVPLKEAKRVKPCLVSVPPRIACRLIEGPRMFRVPWALKGSDPQKGPRHEMSNILDILLL